MRFSMSNSLSTSPTLTMKLWNKNLWKQSRSLPFCNSKSKKGKSISIKNLIISNSYSKALWLISNLNSSPTVPREAKIILSCQMDTPPITVSALVIKTTKPSVKTTVELSGVMKPSRKEKMLLLRGHITQIPRLKHLMHSIRLLLKRLLKLSKTQNSLDSKRPRKGRRTYFWLKK